MEHVVNKHIKKGGGQAIVSPTGLFVRLFFKIT